jgi:hypothetical protein
MANAIKSLSRLISIDVGSITDVRQSVGMEGFITFVRAAHFSHEDVLALTLAALAFFFISLKPQSKQQRVLNRELNSVPQTGLVRNRQAVVQTNARNICDALKPPVRFPSLAESLWQRSTD